MKDPLLKYKIAVSLIPGVGSVNAKKLIAYLGGVENVFKEKKQHLQKIPDIGEKTAELIASSNVLPIAEAELNFIEKYNIKYSYYLDDNYPSRLKNCNDSPVIFFYKGNVDFNSAKIISLVGTRKATDYGKDFCKNLTQELSEKHPETIIVSGLAYGIDIAAHKAALDNNLPTIAVLGHGLDRIYPSLHKPTAVKIIENGALVTEFLSSSVFDRNNFLRRNRIIAGMADATIVVESGVKGGALVTADIANSYNRDVFAVPGKIGEEYSMGCNHLIKTNKAALIENCSDLEYYLGWQNSNKKSASVQKKLFVELNSEEKTLFEIIEKHKEIDIDSICFEAKLPVSKASPLLLNMEFAGVIKCLPGKVYVCC